jgi:hypothetical protein
MSPLLVLFALLLLALLAVAAILLWRSLGESISGTSIARLPPGDTRDLTLETRLGSVLREPADGADTKEQQGS